MIFRKKMAAFEYSDNCLQSFYAGQRSIDRLFLPPTALRTQTTFTRPTLWGDERLRAAGKLPMIVRHDSHC